MTLANVRESAGKRVAARTYVHAAALDELSPEIREVVGAARVRASLSDADFNVIRYDSVDQTISFLRYAGFFENAFPALESSWLVHLASSRISHRTYTDSLNPPILHRKELLLSPSDPRRRPFEALTSELEALGFFGDPVRIGFKLQWERLLRERGFRVVGHELVPIGNDEQKFQTVNEVLPQDGTIARHLTALSRQDMSAPIQLLDRFTRSTSTSCPRGRFHFRIRRLRECLTKSTASPSGWRPMTTYSTNASSPRRG
jgi:hypothetical protein